MDILEPSGCQMHCRLCLRSLKTFGECVEITENVNKAILEIFPLDLICFQSTSIFICEQCLKNIEACSSFRSSIVEKHQELIGKIKIESVDVKTEGFTVAYVIEENRFEDLASLVHSPDHGSQELKCPPYEADDVKFDDYEFIKPEVPAVAQTSKKFDCEGCDEAFMTRLQLLLHRKKDHQSGIKRTKISSFKARSKDGEWKCVRDKRMVSCEVCGKVMQSDSMRQHRTTHDESARKFGCDLCGKKFRKKSTAAEHVLTHIPKELREKLFKCQVCFKESKSENYLRRHVRICHPSSPRKSFECLECGGIFKRQCILQLHIKRIHQREESQRTCETCGKLFATQYDLNRHNKITHLKIITGVDLKQSELVTCEVCGKTMQRCSMRRHVEIHGQGAYRLSCDMCERRFRIKGHLAEHMQSHVPKEFRQRIYHCTICQKRYSKKSVLRNHMKYVHSSDSSASFDCHCGKSFKNRSILKTHIHRIHNRQQSQRSCELCAKVYATQTDLNNHMKALHSTATKDFMCSECGMMFISKQRLSGHQKNHGKETLECDFGGCGKKFMGIDRLNFHKKIVHLKQKDFKCPIGSCEKSYAKNHLLKNHIILSHDKVRENCPVDDCKFNAGRRDQMRNHMKKHTELTTAEMNDALEIVKKMKVS